MSHGYGSSSVIQALEGGAGASLEQDCYETAPRVWLCFAVYEKPCLKEKGGRKFEESRHRLGLTHSGTHMCPRTFEHAYTY